MEAGICGIVIAFGELDHSVILVEAKVFVVENKFPGIHFQNIQVFIWNRREPHVCNDGLWIVSLELHIGVKRFLGKIETLWLLKNICWEAAYLECIRFFVDTGKTNQFINIFGFRKIIFQRSACFNAAKRKDFS